MYLSTPRILVAGLRGGSGKTLLSLGLAASFRSRGLVVAPFKKGPDYIDASWLSRAAGRPCRNLDLFLFSPSIALGSFSHGSEGADLAIIEGNRGVFDGMDAEGTFSTAELAKLLKAPVLLSVDATKTTRTAAALVLGCQTLDPDLPLAGVILNRTAGSRHESVLTQAMEGICGIPVMGAIPKLPEDFFPERHLGLVPPQETAEADGPLADVARVVERYLEMDRILKAASAAGPLEIPPQRPQIHLDGSAQSSPPERPRIGVFRDQAFQFYYPENLEALAEAGGELVEISPITDDALPPVDGLYLGGGFPETMAPGLSKNLSFLTSVREAADRGLPVYAECGGAVYLGRRLHFEGQAFDMVGFFPAEFGFRKKPEGHGYAVLETTGKNPYFEMGTHIRGHEFHYTYLQAPEDERLSFVFKVHRGTGFGDERDGLVKGNVLASYTHIHALGTVGWAPALIQAASRFRSEHSRTSVPA